jgi:putative ABC transport system permease protein
VDSLAAARDRFYAQGHFADVFAGVKRAPQALTARSLLALPGVADAQTSIEFDVRLSLPGVGDPILGHLIGLDPRLPLRLNRITLKRGMADDPGLDVARPRMRPDGALPAWVSESFALAHRVETRRAPVSR